VAKGKIRTLKDKRSRRSRGFTFFELAIVLFLLGFIFLLAMPKFRDLGPGDTKRAVLKLVGSLRYAQSQAATTKNFYRLNLDVKENSFWITVADKGKFVREGTREGQPGYLPAGVSFLDVDHPERGKIREGAAFVEFSPTGWAEECTIHLRKSEEEIFTIFINPLGGKIETVAGYAERSKG
jgi:Tfp pilus assembly protein FimT